MNKVSKMTLKMILIVAISLLVGCDNLTFPTTVCHATNDPANPYSEIIVNNADELLEYRGYANDIFPMPLGGCPTAPLEVNNNGKITICHATSSAKNPYNEITVSINGLNGHDKHEGDIIPAPAGGCPTTNVDGSKQNKGQEKK